MALLSVSPTQVGIELPATELLGIVCGRVGFEGVQLGGFKNSGEGHSLHIAGGGIRGSSTGEQGGAGHFMSCSSIGFAGSTQDFSSKLPGAHR